MSFSLFQTEESRNTKVRLLNLRVYIAHILLMLVFVLYSPWLRKVKRPGVSVFFARWVILQQVPSELKENQISVIHNFFFPT